MVFANSAGSGSDELLIASPATVIDKIARYRALGFEYLMVRHIVGDHSAMLASFERIGRHVIPLTKEM